MAAIEEPIPIRLKLLLCLKTRISLIGAINGRAFPLVHPVWRDSKGTRANGAPGALRSRGPARPETGESLLLRLVLTLINLLLKFAG